MGVKPKRSDAPIDQPTAEELKGATIKLEKFGNGSGYTVTGRDGQTLRQLVDTTGDNNLNEFRYFQHGLETYRETNTDKDPRIEEYRWMNTAGTRWGVDRDGDGKIETWKRISAEEATSEAVAALASGDAARLQALMIAPDDVQRLGISGEIAQQILKRAADVPGQMKTALASRQIDRTTRWERFDSAMLMPVLIPAESGKASDDVLVYENVTAVARTGKQDVFLNIGEVIQVGNTWKLTRVPQPLDLNSQSVTDGGLLLQPTMGAAPTSIAGGLTPEMEKLTTALQQLDTKRPSFADGPQKMTEYNVARARLLEQIEEAAPSRDDKMPWHQQRIDGIAAAALLGAYPKPLETLKALEEQEEFDEFKPYLRYRRLQVEYGSRVRNAKDAEGQREVQEWYLGELEKFVRAYPKSEDAPAAIWELGSAYEMAGDVKKAQGWYKAAADAYGDTIPGQKSGGAIRRIGLIGEPLQLSGKAIGGGQVDLSQYRGKVTAVVFWTTWAAPFAAQLPDLLELKKEFGENGFEVVGVNLDGPQAPVDQFIKEQQVNFPSIDSEAGGTDGPMARQFGIIQLPTIFLIDREGKVVDNSATIEELSRKVPVLLLRRASR